MAGREPCGLGGSPRISPTPRYLNCRASTLVPRGSGPRSPLAPNPARRGSRGDSGGRATTGGGPGGWRSTLGSPRSPPCPWEGWGGHAAERGEGRGGGRRHFHPVGRWKRGAHSGRPTPPGAGLARGTEAEKEIESAHATRTGSRPAQKPPPGPATRTAGTSNVYRGGDVKSLTRDLSASDHRLPGLRLVQAGPAPSCFHLKRKQHVYFRKRSRTEISSRTPKELTYEKYSCFP